MTGDDLLIQPAARPEPAAVRKPAPAPDEAEAPSFADVLDAETETTEKPEANSDVAAPTAPVIQPAPQPTTATASILAALQTVVTEPQADAAAAEAADATTDVPVVAKPDASTIVAKPAAPAVEIALTTPAVAVAAVATTVISAKPGKLAGAEATETLEEDDKPTTETRPATEATTASDAAAQAILAVPAPAAPVEAAPVAVATGASLSIPAAPKAAALVAPAAAPVPADASSSGASTSAPEAKKAQPASSGVSPAQASADAQATAKAAASDARATETKVDVTAPQTSSTTSTSVVDALTAQAPAGDTGAAKAPPALAGAPQAVAQVYTRFIERHDGRAQRFEIRLDPAELGRVDVRIEVGADKKVHAVLAAHDSAALTDLMKGRQALERALSDAGIDLADGGLSFEMSKDTGRGLSGDQSQGEGWSGRDANVWRAFSPVDVPVETSATDLAMATRTYRRAAARLDLVA